MGLLIKSDNSDNNLDLDKGWEGSAPSKYIIESRYTYLPDLDDRSRDTTGVVFSGRKEKTMATLSIIEFHAVEAKLLDSLDNDL